MNEVDRERVKLTATYFNGIAISILVVFGFSLPMSFRNTASGLNNAEFAVILWIILFIFALGASIQMHWWPGII
jgi:hypothetical protein